MNASVIASASGMRTTRAKYNAKIAASKATSGQPPNTGRRGEDLVKF